MEVPIAIKGSLSSSAKSLLWESPLFQTDVHGGLTEKCTVQTREGNAAMNALIGFVVGIELSPDDVRQKAGLTWPRVHGPHGASA